MPKEFLKSPDDKLDYKFDFAAETNERSDADGDWLASGETISTKTVTASTGLTVDAGAITDSNTSVTVWVSGGTVTVPPTVYTVYCKIVTSAGREVKKSMTFKVV